MSTVIRQIGRSKSGLVALGLFAFQLVAAREAPAPDVLPPKPSEGYLGEVRYLKRLIDADSLDSAMNQAMSLWLADPQLDEANIGIRRSYLLREIGRLVQLDERARIRFTEMQRQAFLRIDAQVADDSALDWILLNTAIDLDRWNVEWLVLIESQGKPLSVFMPELRAALDESCSRAGASRQLVALYPTFYVKLDRERGRLAASRQFCAQIPDPLDRSQYESYAVRRYGTALAAYYCALVQEACVGRQQAYLMECMRDQDYQSIDREIAKTCSGNEEEANSYMSTLECLRNVSPHTHFWWAWVNALARQ